MIEALIGFVIGAASVYLWARPLLAQLPHRDPKTGRFKK